MAPTGSSSSRARRSWSRAGRQRATRRPAAAARRARRHSRAGSVPLTLSLIVAGTLISLRSLEHDLAFTPLFGGPRVSVRRRRALGIGTAAIVAEALISGLAVFLPWRMRDVTMAIVVGILGSLLAAPYLHSYDLVLLLVAGRLAVGRLGAAIYAHGRLRAWLGGLIPKSRSIRD